MSSWPTRAASGIRASTDATVGRGVAVGCRVGVGAGRVDVGPAIGVGDGVVGVAEASGVAGGSGGIALHAVAAPSVTATATATSARTPRRYGTVATRSRESA